MTPTSGLISWQAWNIRAAEPEATIQPPGDAQMNSDRTPGRASTYNLSFSRPLLRVLTPALLLGCFMLQLWIHATRTSATSDEPVHILAGYRYWQCGDYTVNPEHPPLLKLLATLPLQWSRPSPPSTPCGDHIGGDLENFHAGALFLAQNGVDPVLVVSRGAAASMSVLLALAVFFAARELFGRDEAVVALALFVFEPTLIAHGSLVTTDMALAATMFIAVYALYRYRHRPTLFRLALTGLAAGLLLAAKHTGAVVLPLLFLLLVADILLFGTPPGGPASRARSLFNGVIASLAILCMAVGVLWCTYGLRPYALPGVGQKRLSIPVLFASTKSEGTLKRLVELTDRTGLLPEAYMFGLAAVLAASQRPMYLLGKVYPTGRWFYFPIAFVIKSSIALLLLLPLGLLTRALYRKHPREMLFLIVPSAAYFAISLTAGINIGVRHILPVYPFFIVIAAAGACVWSRRHRLFFYALIALLLYHAGTAFRTAPNYIAFANDFWGGPRNTYRWLQDSNADWGQGLKQVETYLQANGIQDCWIAAFGMADLVRQYHTCRKLPAFGWEVTEQLVDLVPPEIEGTILLSVWALPPWAGPEYEAITRTQPIDVIGGGTLVYRGRFAVPLATALSYAARSSQLLGWGRWHDGLEDARKAVEWGPDDARTHRVLAIAYARNGMMDDAQRENETADRLLPERAKH